MRKHRVAVMVMAVMMVMVFMSGCGKSSMVGTWKVTMVRDSGSYYNIKQFGALIGEEWEIELSLKRSGKFVFSSKDGRDNATLEGTWEYEKPVLTLDFDREELNGALDNTLTYNDGELTWGNPNNSNLMIFEKK